MKSKSYLIFIFLGIFFGCKKDVRLIIPCQNKIDLGEFLLSETTDSIFHYPEFVSRPLFSSNHEDSIILKINYPTGLENHIMTYQGSSECRDLGKNEYLYSVQEKLVNAHFIVSDEFTINGPNAFFRLTSVFKEGLDSFEKTNEVLLFYAGKPAYWTDRQIWLREDPLASVFILEKPENRNDIDNFYPTLELNNYTYQNIYVSSNLESAQYLSKIYFSLKEGIIGIDNKEGTTWTIH